MTGVSPAREEQGPGFVGAEGLAGGLRAQVSRAGEPITHLRGRSCAQVTHSRGPGTRAGAAVGGAEGIKMLPGRERGEGEGTAFQSTELGHRKTEQFPHGP